MVDGLMIPHPSRLNYPNAMYIRGGKPLFMNGFSISLRPTHMNSFDFITKQSIFNKVETICKQNVLMHVVLVDVR